MINEYEIRLGKGDVGMAVYNVSSKDDYTYVGSGVCFHNIEPREIASGDYAKLDEMDIQYGILSTSSESIQVLIEQLQEAKQRLIDKGV